MAILVKYRPNIKKQAMFKTSAFAAGGSSEAAIDQHVRPHYRSNSERILAVAWHISRRCRHHCFWWFWWACGQNRWTLWSRIALESFAYIWNNMEPRPLILYPCSLLPCGYTSTLGGMGWVDFWNSLWIWREHVFWWNHSLENVIEVLEQGAEDKS